MSFRVAWKAEDLKPWRKLNGTIKEKKGIKSLIASQGCILKCHLIGFEARKVSGPVGFQQWWQNKEEHWKEFVNFVLLSQFLNFHEKDFCPSWLKIKLGSENLSIFTKRKNLYSEKCLVLDLWHWRLFLRKKHFHVFNGATHSVFLGVVLCRARIWTSMILMDPFHPRIFYDSMFCKIACCLHRSINLTLCVETAFSQANPPKSHVLRHLQGKYDPATLAIWKTALQNVWPSSSWSVLTHWSTATTGQRLFLVCSLPATAAARAAHKGLCWWDLWATIKPHQCIGSWGSHCSIFTTPQSEGNQKTRRENKKSWHLISWIRGQV